MPNFYVFNNHGIYLSKKMKLKARTLIIAWIAVEKTNKQTYPMIQRLLRTIGGTMRNYLIIIIIKKGYGLSN